MKTPFVLPSVRIESKIFMLRGKKVMFDRDLAELYGVETKRLNEAVRRNKKRFPEDFMFQLNKSESDAWFTENLRSQFATSSSRSQIATLKRGSNIKYFPMVFTEQGVAMLSSVLNSERAINVNIQIIRTFTKLRELIATNKELREKLEKMEKKYDNKFKVVFDTLRELLESPKEPQKPRIGFKV